MDLILHCKDNIRFNNPLSDSDSKINLSDRQNCFSKEDIDDNNHGQVITIELRFNIILNLNDLISSQPLTFCLFMLTLQIRSQGTAGGKDV